jgi:hypothetical protein
MKEHITAGCIGLVCFIAGLFFGAGHWKNTGQQPAINEPVQVDTVFVAIHDTLVTALPAEIKYIEKVVPEVVDTAAVVRDYYASRVYEDTRIINNNFSLSIRDTVSENSIFGRSITYDLRLPEITRTVTYKPKYTLSVLADTRLSPALLFGYRQMYIQTGYDFRRKEPFVGVGLKLWER